MGYWECDEERYYDLDALCDWLFNPEQYDDDDGFEDWVNECYCDSYVTIGGVEFSPYTIIDNCDSYLCREMRSEYQNSQAESDREYFSDELSRMADGDEEWVNGNLITYHESEDDSEDEDDDDEELDEEEEIIIKTLLDHFQKVQ